MLMPREISRACELLRAASQRREVTTDMVSGVVTHHILRDSGKQRDLSHGLVSGGVAREWWSVHPDDPQSARARAHWTEETERGDIRIRTETFSEMWSDATHFHVSGRLEAYENDRLVLERAVSDSIARDHM